MSKTPFGWPLDPEVYMIHARSDGDGGTGSMGFSFPRSRRVSYWKSFRDGVRPCSLDKSEGDAFP